MTNPTWDVVGIGENSIDDIYRLPALPSPNAKIPVAAYRQAPGGQVATAMCACARLGLRASYIGAFGDDEHGARIRAALDERGVHIGHAVVRNAPNRHAVILVDERSGDRVVLWRRDPALTLAAHELRHDAVTATRLLHVDATDAAFSLAAARAARRSGVRVTSDIDEATTLTTELVASVDVAILADGIPQSLTGESHIETALRTMRRQSSAWLCVTLGERGALLLEGDRLHRSEAVPIEAVDTTGAGDVFRAGFIYALLQGHEPARILRFATAAAAVSCTREGAIESVPSLDEVLAVLDGRWPDGRYPPSSHPSSSASA